MATLLIVGAIMTGCSSDDNINNPQQPANNDNVVTLTATVGFKANATTRSVDPSNGVKTFESGNQITVIYTNTSNETVKAVSTDFTPTGDGTKATFTVSLTNPASNSAIRYIYPATMAKDVATNATITDDAATIDYTGLFGSQNGDLTTLGTNYDLAVFDGSLSGTDLPALASLTNPLAICKFTLTDGSSSITSAANSLTIINGTNTYAISPSGLSEIYVAMKPVTSGDIGFTAATGSKTYFKTAKGVTIAAGTLYTNITVSMIDVASLTVGQVIGDDGKNYAVDALPTGVNAVAKICYVGSDNGEAAPYNHGLALALSDANSGKPCKWKTSNTDAGHTKQTSSSFTNESGLQYNATHNTTDYPAFQTAIANNGTAAPTGCSFWFLASGYQWQKMMNAYSLESLMTTAGGYTGLDSNPYWSSSEFDSSVAWNYYFGLDAWNNVYKDSTPLVRSCLAF